MTDPSLFPLPAPVVPAALSSTQVAALDAADHQEEFTQWISGEQGQRLGQSRLLLGGMHCAACAGLIEDALQREPGVLSAEVGSASQRASVVWDPALTQPSRLIEAVRRAGYGAYPDTGAEAVAMAQRESHSALWRLFVAAFCMMQVMMYATPAYVAVLGDMTEDMTRLLRWASWVLTLPVMLFAAGPYLKGSWRALRQRRIGMDVPVALGLVVAFVASSAATFEPDGSLGRDVYFDSLTMFLSFLLAARWLESRARRRAAQSLDAVMRQLPDAVERLDPDGGVSRVRPAQLQVGDWVRVQVGQAFAADGRLLRGHTEVDESMLTGESLPVARGVGDSVNAGCLNLGGPVEMEVLLLGAHTRYQRIVALVERALTQRPAFMVATDRWAGPFLWLVLALAAAGWLAWQFIDPSRALWVAVSVLIVTCPCALSLGAPVSLLAAAGELARQGVLLQRLDALEVLTRAKDWVFDKTGTLTQDGLTLAQVQRLLPAEEGPAPGLSWLAWAGALAEQSLHPLSRALRAAAPPLSAVAWQGLREVSGSGVEAWEGDELAGDAPASQAPPRRLWRLGSAAWCGLGAGPGQATLAADLGRPAVWLARGDLARDGEATTWVPVARFDFDESLRPDAPAALAELRAQGMALHLLSGDQAVSVARVASGLGISQARAGCTPDDKLAAVQALQAQGRVVVMVGDGVNDAPVLARADVSVAMGSAAALAQARADVIVLSNRLSDLTLLQRTAERTMRVVHQNLAWAAAYNFASVPLALAGWLPPWLAGAGMALSSLLVVLNSLRLTRPLPNRGAGATLGPQASVQAA